MSQETRQLRVRIFDELSKIVDPEINTSITDLELIDNVDIEGSDVKVDLHLTSPFCPAVFGFKICQDIHDNLLKIDSVDNVTVNVSNHFMAEQINNQVNSSPKPPKDGAAQPEGQGAAQPGAAQPEGQGAAQPGAAQPEGQGAAQPGAAQGEGKGA